MIPTISHVILDLDGLLIDTETIYTQCYEQLCDQYGKKFTWEIKSEQMGKPPDESARVIIEKLNLPISIQEHHELINQLLNQKFPHCQLMPGAKDLIMKLHNMQIPMCIATGSDKSSFDLKLQNQQWMLQYMSHIVCCGSDPEVTKGKPAPDCFIVAANRFQQKPKLMQNILVFEDATNGVIGAVAADMQAVWCPDPRADTKLFDNHCNVRIVPSLSDFPFELYCFKPL